MNTNVKTSYKSFTIPRYQKQHQLPFRENLKNKKCKPKEVFISEGKFAGMFGWNLTHTPIGGLMGLPGNKTFLDAARISFSGGEVTCMMPSVDVYCREDDLLSENWIILDFPYWLKDQGTVQKSIFKKSQMKRP